MTLTHWLPEDHKIWVAGHTGLVGSALMRALGDVGASSVTATHSQLDLTKQKETEEWVEAHRPTHVIVAAAKVGGIGANSDYPADFIAQNLAITQNVITAAARIGVKKLVYLGSSCIYPKLAPQPIKEDSLLTGPLEPTNEAYAIAKIAGVKLCQFYRRQYGHDFISVMPCNLYGVGDRWDDEGGHVIPMLIHKFHQAKITGVACVELWGDGTPLREFLNSDDAARGILTAMKNYSGELPINLGSGSEIMIRDAAELIAKVIGFQGSILWNTEKPNGAPRKILDSEKMRKFHWYPKISLEDGLHSAYKDYINYTMLQQSKLTKKANA